MPRAKPALSAKPKPTTKAVAKPFPNIFSLLDWSYQHIAKDAELRNAFMLVSGGFAVLSSLLVWAARGESSPPLALVATHMFVIVASMILSVCFQIAVSRRILGMRDGKTVPERLPEAAKRILPVLWTGMTTAFVVLGSLFIPIVGLLLYGTWTSLAKLTAISGEAYGLAATERSVNVVRGAWWRMFGYDLAFIMMFALPLITVGFATAVAAAVGGPIGILFSFVMGAAGAVISTFFMAYETEKYVAFVAAKPSAAIAGPHRTVEMLILCWLGIVIAIIIAAFMIASSMLYH